LKRIEQKAKITKSSRTVKFSGTSKNALKIWKIEAQKLKSLSHTFSTPKIKAQERWHGLWRWWRHWE
jgi:hypothetical protein